MKVADIGTITNDTRTMPAVNDRRADTGAVLDFERHITELSQAHYEEYIEDLRNQIFEQGEEIKKKSDICGFLKYRKLISELVGEVASNAYATSRSSAFDGKGKHKVFILIKKVNSKLDEMAQEILKQQSDNLKLLDMVDDIRGLIVDMFL